jgi:hypothetical protein
LRLSGKKKFLTPQIKDGTETTNEHRLIPHVTNVITPPNCSRKSIMSSVLVMINQQQRAQ